MNVRAAMPYLPADPPPTALDMVRAVLSRETTRRLPTDIPTPNGFFGSGRAALWAALRALDVGAGDEVLLPSYLCESVVSPVLAVGALARFYPVGRDLRPDLAALDELMTEATRVVVGIHYFGFPGPVRELRAWCDSRHVALIEDCAHALYSRLEGQLLGSFGDAAIFSPWKSLPLPDGGLLVLRVPFRNPTTSLGSPALARTVFRLAYRSLGTVENFVGWSPRLTLLQRPRLRRDLHDRSSGAPVELVGGSRIAWRLLLFADSARIVARRRANYLRLLDAARALSWAQPLIADLPEGVCPLGLPLVAEERDHWRDSLLRLGVNVRTFWEHLPAEVDLDMHPDAKWVRDRILILPVHQGLSSAQIDWLARSLLALSSRKGHAALAHR